MNEHNINYGDTIRVYVKLHNRISLFIDIDMQVVGKWIRAANQNNIYCPLPLGALDPEHSSLNELGETSIRSTGKYYSYVSELIDISDDGNADKLTQQQKVDVMLDNNMFQH